MRGRISYLSLALLLAGCYSGRGAAEPADTRDPKTRVYAAALDARYVADAKLLGREAKLLLVVDKTSADLERFRERRKEMRLAPQDVLDDFEAKNSQPRALNSDFGLKVRTLTVSEEEVRRLAQVKDGTMDSKPLQDKYPDASGVITLSRVGFNRDFTQALVEVDRGWCGRGCGEGTFVLLVKEDSRWKIREYYGGYMA
ncbi:MAG: hypothetical protein ACJ74Q_21630 [Pyrinomonadaceae bacterium]